MTTSRTGGGATADGALRHCRRPARPRRPARALTLSLCTAFLTELVQVRAAGHVVDVGFDRVRFRAPVPVGARLRGTAELRGTRRMTGGARVVVRITAEIEGVRPPACVADQVLMFST